jgi:hypothetical protein
MCSRKFLADREGHVSHRNEVLIAAKHTKLLRSIRIQAVDALILSHVTNLTLSEKHIKHRWTVLPADSPFQRVQFKLFRCASRYKIS